MPNFTLDNLTPIGIATWYTLHGDEREANMLADLCAVLRADADFSAAFSYVNDGLREKHGLCPRVACSRRRRMTLASTRSGT